jgi:hypothetical protein
MKTALVVLFLFSLAGAACAQERQAALPEKDSSEARRLGSVTWDLKNHKLVWTIEKGATVNGEFVPSTSDRYEISPDDAVMAFSDQKRGFAEAEATSLQHLLDVLSLYCAESVVWWDQGQGVPVNGAPGAPKSRDKDARPARPGDKPTRVDQPQPQRKPRPRLSATDMVASAAPVK